MSLADLRHLVARARALASRPAALAGGAAALILGLTLGLSAVRTSSAHDVDATQSVGAGARRPLSPGAFQKLMAGMDPAALALARSYDPFAKLKGLDSPAAVGLNGWRLAVSDGSPNSAAELAPFSPVQGAEAERINASLPFSTSAVPPAQPFVLTGVSKAERERAVRCLTNAIYYEAALEPVEGQRAVAQVVLNRVRDPNFPKSICGVVYEGWDRVTGCQFSFTCDGALVRSPIAELWNRERKVAEAALNGSVMPAVGVATHYHADYVAPYWAPTLVKISQIGAHIFYRWPGNAGLPGAFTGRYAGGELKLSEAVLSGAARPAPAPLTAAGGPLVVASAAADGRVRTTVMVGATPVEATPATAPALYGRRQPTPEEVARINAMLEARFPEKKPETPAVASTPAPAPASTAAAATPASAAPASTVAAG